MGKIFGNADLCKYLEKLGFTYHSSNSSHYKYSVPQGHHVPDGLRPFMMVQIKREYDKNACNRYRQELLRLGFTKEQIDVAFDIK